MQSTKPSKKETQTIEYKNLKLIVFPEVYPPHEDSFLLAEQAELLSYGRVLDMGCGSGIVGICASKNKAVKEIVLADTSQFALKNASLNYRKNQPSRPMKLCQTNLFSNFSGQKFDTILFNPPYLPTTDEEKLKGAINKAFDGGKDGRKIIDKFFIQLKSHLEVGGILLYLHSSLTGDVQTFDFLSNNGYRYEKLKSEKFFFEELCVLKIQKI